MDKFLGKNIVKVFSVYLNPIIIGILASSLGNWSAEGDKYFIYRVVALILLFGWYMYSAYMYSYKLQNEERKESLVKIESLSEDKENLERENKMLERRIAAYDRGMRELAATFYDSANSINTVANNILDGKRRLETWSFKRVATTICDSVYNILCEACSPQDNFGVNIMLYDMTVKAAKRKNIIMIAHKGKYQDRPGKFEEKIYFASNPSFYAVKLFKQNRHKVKILISPEEINEKFVYMDDEHPSYCQYVGIPIVCSGNQMISLLQICTFDNCKIAESKEEISKIVAKYIFPFSHYALLAYKIEKSLINSLSIIEKMEVSGSGTM